MNQYPIGELLKSHVNHTMIRKTKSLQIRSATSMKNQKKNINLLQRQAYDLVHLNHKPPRHDMCPQYLLVNRNPLHQNPLVPHLRPGLCRGVRPRVLQVHNVLHIYPTFLMIIILVAMLGHVRNADATIMLQMYLKKEVVIIVSISIK